MTFRKDLEPREAKILNYLKRYIAKNSYPPTVREICKALNITSTATVYYSLNRLQYYGYIRKSDNHKRAIEILSEYSDFPKKETIEIPLVGKITAGEPITAVENIEDVYPLPEDLFGDGELFILNVVGDSMIKAGIHSGDKIVIRKQSVADNGEIAAVMIDGQATVKRFYREQGHIRLQPENDTLSPIIIEDGEVEIIGVAAGLIRRM